MQSRKSGAVVSYNGSFAFVSPDGEDRDVFFHVSEWQGDPTAIHLGDRVTFDIAADTYKPGRLCAKQVRPSEEEPPE